MARFCSEMSSNSFYDFSLVKVAERLGFRSELEAFKVNTQFSNFWQSIS